MLGAVLEAAAEPGLDVVKAASVARQLQQCD